MTDGFISHSSANRALAVRLEKALEATGLSIWLDDSEIRLGVLLGQELHESIRKARAVILLWSDQASKSRWIATEWLTAFHLGRFIVPCSLDDTPLPQCLRGTVYLRIRRVTPGIVEDLARTLRDAPRRRNEVPPTMGGQSPALVEAINTIAGRQYAMHTELETWNLTKARSLQAKLDPITDNAVATWPFDPTIVNLVGYHLKNAYMLKHWDEVQAGRSPKDPILNDAERRFFETLSIDPTDPEALNGLGSILLFKHDVEAAEFFIRAAIAEAKRRKIDYPAAEADLAMVRRFTGG